MNQDINYNNPDLELLFRPGSVAVIGASPDPSQGGGFMWKRIFTRYLGRKYPVSLKHETINGVKAFRSVKDIEDTIDLAVIAVPAAAVEAVIQECAEKKVKFAFIHTAGFAELSDDGGKLQQRMAGIAREGRIRLVGPNCMGMYCPDTGLNTIIDAGDTPMIPGNIAYCGQTGWGSGAFITEGTARGLNFSTVVSSGNQADLDMIDYIGYFGSDHRTRIICAYVEGVERGRQFFRLISKIGFTKPVIIWKAGLSKSGARAAISHTGSIAGNRDIWQGAARGAGIITAEGLEDLVDKTAAFYTPFIPKGKRIGIVVESGGGSISAADACEKEGLLVEPFSVQKRRELFAMLAPTLPPFSGINNPLDLVWIPIEQAMTISLKCVEMVSDEIDAAIFMVYQPFLMPSSRQSYIDAMCRIRDAKKIPIYIVSPLPSRTADSVKEFTSAGLPVFPSMERAAKAIAAAARYRMYIADRSISNP
jgi:acyl-CoA synthetase (NDP forming)